MSVAPISCRLSERPFDGLAMRPQSRLLDAMNRTLLRCALAAALGGLLFGFDIVVISGTTRTLTETFHLNEWSLGLTVSSALWAMAIGALASGYVAERFGRRAGLRITAALFLVSAAGCAVAPGKEMDSGNRGHPENL